MMRRRLRLTTRGKGMLLGGAAMIALGLLLDSLAVRTAGVFAIVLVSLAAAWTFLLATRSTCRRHPVPGTLRHGETVDVVVEVHRPLGGYGYLCGLLPSWAPGTPVHSAVRLHPGDTQLTASGRGLRRGRHRWPQVRLEIPDPLGLVHGVLRTSADDATVVFPRVEPLAAARMPTAQGAAPAFDEALAALRLVPHDAGANPIPRPYRAGDGLRRMHWSATARIGEPMVRAEDAPPVRRAVVLLDTSSSAYHSKAGFERAVSAAASIAVRLLQLGWIVSVRLPGGWSPLAAARVEGRSGETAVLTGLADVALGEPSTSLPPPREPVDAAFAVTGGGQSWPWPMRADVTIRTEPDGADQSLVWDGRTPFAAIWGGAARPVAP